MNAIKKPSSSWIYVWRDFRFLIVIVIGWGIIGLYEVSRSDLPERGGSVQQEWLLNDEVNLAKTLLEVYPNRSLGHFMRSYQAGMCWEAGYRLPVCDSFEHKGLEDVRDALEAAIERGGAGDQEELYHFYAFILVKLNESPEKIEAAVERWRRHFPYSQRPDPRG